MVRSFFCSLFCLVFALVAGSVEAQSKVSVDGHVTRLEPPISFRLNQQLVVTTPSTTFVIPSDPNGSQEDINFSLGLISIGKRIVVRGVEDLQTHTITARRIEALDGGSLAHRSGHAWEDSAPALTKDGSGWRGTVYVDGYEIAVDAKTTVQLAQGMTDPTVFRPDLQVVYQAERQNDGSLLAKSVSFAVDGNIADEERFRADSDFKIDLPDYDKKLPGKVHFFLQSYRILPDRQLQEAINAFGQNLVPAWQRRLPDSDPAKIHFRFFVLEKSKALQKTLSNDSGTVLIPSQVITKLQNEAQLACLLSADIAVAIENDIYRSRSRKHTQEAIDVALIPGPFGGAGQMINDGAFSAGYWTPLIEHEYRVGLRYVMAAGYDPREAPFALQRLAAKHPDATAGKSLPSLGNYMDAELGFDYMGIDSKTLHKGEAEYADLLTLAYVADAKLKVDSKTPLVGN